MANYRKVNIGEIINGAEVLCEIEPRTYSNGKNERRFLLRCICSNTFERCLDQTRTLKSGKPANCGCLLNRHGFSNTKFYDIWVGLRQRCTNTNNNEYKNYGARGICVDDRWNNFLNFKDDMYGTYKDGLSIDRIDNNLGYSKDNCRWATDAEQSKNTRRNVIFNNECATDASARLGGNNGLVKNRLRLGWDIEKAFTIPVIK